MKDVIIIGGGLAGLTNAIQLADAGLDVLVIEKKQYPFHRVCGEYISNEALPFLKSIGVDPEILGPSKIEKLLVSSPSGNTMKATLDRGGFGVSRFALDNYLYTIAMSKGAEFQLNTFVTNVKFENDTFYVLLSTGEVEEAKLVIGGFGKRSNLDRQLQRDFFIKKSPYVAVKYHIQTDFPNDLIALHNFKDGYCGISKIEGDRYCLCYMTTRENLSVAGSIPKMEESILHRNPFLKNIFNNSTFLYDKPEVINEISFDSKNAVDHHILMSGDAAGMITPLCGNGMAMAIHSSKILSALIVQHYKPGGFSREMLERSYEEEWKNKFSFRLAMGRGIQQLFGKERLTDVTVKLLDAVVPLKNWVVRQTHGNEF